MKRSAQGVPDSSVLVLLVMVCSLASPAVGYGQAVEVPAVPGISADRSADKNAVATDSGAMSCYSERIPGTDVMFEMIPIPGGEFLLGSPEGKAGRNSDEGPQVRVRVAPFWIGKFEVTWAEYHAYMAMYEAFKILNQLQGDEKNVAKLPPLQKYFGTSLQVDGVTSPTPLYDPDTTYQAGDQPDQPAVTMTQFAAKQYTKWLSGITGQQYRLPSEAEWEYAARAGSTAAYAYGDDPQQLSDYAWYEVNSDSMTHKVGTKLPNDLGVHDMHGNVAEWVLDAYREEHYESLQRKKADAAAVVAWPTRLSPRSIRGGCWFDGAALCRSAARHKSDDPEWNLSDPNLPKSPWWFTEEPASGVGFRIVRSLRPMDGATKKRVWEADIERIQEDVAERLEEGRGAQSAADLRLPAALDAIEEEGLIE